MKKVSVIIAVYNAEKYLRECIESVIKQTYQNLEIICVNDGSTDKSLEILEEYAGRDHRVRIYTKDNEGLGGASARNYGLAKANGEYISFLDSDDFFELDMYEKAVALADRTTADIVIMGGDEFDNISRNFIKVSSILNQDVIPVEEVFSFHDCPETIFQLTQGMAWNKLYKKSFVDENKLDFQRIKYTDDAYFTFASLICAKRITVLNENLCHYRVNTGTNQTSGLTNYPDSSFGPYIKLKKLFVEWNVFDEVKQSFVNCTAAFLRYFYDQIDRWDAFEYLHNRYRNDIFQELSIDKHTKEYFYDPLVYAWVSSIIENDAGELAFKAARAFGVKNTTASLRFSFQKLDIPCGSRIALIGEGITGQHYYAQMVLSGEYDVVIWCNCMNDTGYSYIRPIEELFETDYDYILLAYKKEKLIESTKELLIRNGVDEKKIIVFGG